MTPSRSTSRWAWRLETFILARTPSGFIAEVRGDEPEIAAKLRMSASPKAG